MCRLRRGDPRGSPGRARPGRRGHGDLPGRMDGAELGARLPGTAPRPGVERRAGGTGGRPGLAGSAIRTHYRRPCLTPRPGRRLPRAGPRAAGPPRPPPPHQPQQPPPRFRTETNLGRVDVYATKGGEPVQDLTADDFEVYEDNAPQKVDSFEHIVVRTGGSQEERSEPASVTA